MDDTFQPKSWMRHILIGAGIYNIVWGLWAVVQPLSMLSLYGVDPLPRYPQFWQCIGMIVGVYGIGYLIAARQPYRQWPIILVGLLGKVFGAIGFLMALVDGSLPSSLGWMLLTNDLIWWIPFTWICWGALRSSVAANSVHSSFDYDDPIRELQTNDGSTLSELSAETPQLVVLLRHVGCPFCRESLARLSRQREIIEAAGYGIVLVHLGQDANAQGTFTRYGLEDLPRIYDPECRLYRQFGLDLGSFGELFGFNVWFRAILSGVLFNHGIGRIQGNAFQMPGAFLLHCGQFIRGMKPGVASEPMDFFELVRNAPQPAETVASV